MRSSTSTNVHPCPPMSTQCSVAILANFRKELFIRISSQFFFLFTKLYAKYVGSIGFFIDYLLLIKMSKVPLSLLIGMQKN